MSRLINRKLSNPLIYIPNWKTESAVKKTWKRYRSACSNYGNRKKVREFIFTRDNYTCKICGSKKNIQIDHIISAKTGYDDKIDIRKINSIENLQTLCKSCNCAKAV